MEIWRVATCCLQGMQQERGDRARAVALSMAHIRHLVTVLHVPSTREISSEQGDGDPCPNMAQMRQSRPIFGLDLQAKVLRTF